MSIRVFVTIAFAVTLAPILLGMSVASGFAGLFENPTDPFNPGRIIASESISAPGQGGTPPAQAKKADPGTAFSTPLKFEERQIEVLEQIRDKLNTAIKTTPQSFIPGSTGIVPRLFDFDNDDWEDLF
jgi:hypothetical protein